LADTFGKYLACAAVPAAESLPAGGAMPLDTPSDL
jgi:hypothetical protein